jgi:hypothetical protein
MALQAIAGVTRTRGFEPAMERGLEWIAGNNILGQEMRSSADKLIWRSIALEGWGPKLEEMRTMLTHRPAAPITPRPHVVHQCRPYELGWALYAQSQC